MKSLVLIVVAMVAFAAPQADAAPKKKYHFKLTKVLVKPEVSAEAGKIAQARVEAVFKKALAEHPQLVADVTGAPDPDKNPQGYRKFLQKKRIAGAYLVTVEITNANEELIPLEDKKNTQRLGASVAIHVLGETIPGRTMGFTGDGSATVKQEVGMKVRDREREFTWDGAAETATAEALKTCFAKLALPPKKQ